jgi:hypothetical protein
VRGIAHVSRTIAIRAEPGAQFGFRYRVVGEPNGGQTPLRLVTRFPPPGLNDPGRGIEHQSEEIVMATVGGTGFHGYELEYDWERVPGRWIFEIWNGDQKIAEQAFSLSLP